MARTRDEHKFQQCRDSLLAVGQELFINSSFNSVGLNDILRKAEIPKGSFYHYFDSKEDFGVQVVEFYSRQGREELATVLADDTLTPCQQLQKFFADNVERYTQLDYCQGCLMSNLSQELADVNERLRQTISELSQGMVDEIATCLEKIDASELNLGGLNSIEAAQVLMNSWQGAIMKMKLAKNRQPLDVFMKFFFPA